MQRKYEDIKNNNKILKQQIEDIYKKKAHSIQEIKEEQKFMKNLWR